MQAAYVGQFHPQIDSSVRFFRELLEIGKDLMDVFTVLTGSSKRAHRFAHHEHLGVLGCQHISTCYPNLNHQVYKTVSLGPIRDKNDFARIWRGDDTLSRDVFFVSGGVPRAFVATQQVSAPQLPDDQPGLMRILREILFRSKLLVYVNDTMKLNKERLEYLRSDPWSLASIPCKMATRIFDEHPHSDGVTSHMRLLLAQDDGYLCDTLNCVTILVPAHAESFAHQFVKYVNVTSYSRLTFSFQITLEGVPDGSIGASLELPILREAVYNKCLPHAQDMDDILSVKGRKLQFKEDQSRILNLDGSEESLDTLPLKEILQFTADMGADGVWFTKGDHGRVVVCSTSYH